MTPEEHTSQRDAVRRSLLLEGIRADRRDMPRRKRLAAPVVPDVVIHRYSIPVVVERERPL